MNNVHPSAAEGYRSGAGVYARSRPDYPEDLLAWLGRGLVWNVRDESVDWVAELTAILAPYEGDTPRFRTGLWRRAVADAPFTALEEFSLPHPHVGPAADVILGRTLSVSFIARLPEAERNRVAERVQALIDGHPDLGGRETVAFPYLTRAFSCVRT